jgi:hypothetical protein
LSRLFTQAACNERHLRSLHVGRTSAREALALQGRRDDAASVATALLKGTHAPSVGPLVTSPTLGLDIAPALRLECATKRTLKQAVATARTSRANTKADLAPQHYVTMAHFSPPALQGQEKYAVANARHAAPQYEPVTDSDGLYLWTEAVAGPGLLDDLQVNAAQPPRPDTCRGLTRLEIIRTAHVAQRADEQRQARHTGTRKPRGSRGKR